MVESAAVARPGQPKLHELAKLWDAHAVVREQVRATGKLLLWPSAKQTGVISKASLSTNRHVILAIVDVWSSTCKTPKAPNIPWLRQEVLSSETPRIMCCSSTDLIHYPIMRHGVLHLVEVEEIHRLLTPAVDKVNVYVDHNGAASVSAPGRSVDSDVGRPSSGTNNASGFLSHVCVRVDFYLLQKQP